MCSEREFDVIMQRGLFMRYLDGEELLPEPSRTEEGEGVPTVLGDEQGEHCVGILKGFPANSDAEMLRQTQLYNVRSGAHPAAARTASWRR